MSGWLFCCGPRRDMGAALSHSQEGECSGQAPGTLAEVIRERKKKGCVGSGGGGLATLRRRLAAAAARRARACTRAHDRGDRGGRGGEHGRALRSAASSWRQSEIAALHDELEALAALRDLAVQAELARAPAPALSADLATTYKNAWCADVELLYRGASFPVHRAILAARCPYFRDLLSGYPGEGARVCVEGLPSRVDAALLHALLLTLYGGEADLRMQRDNARDCCSTPSSRPSDLDILGSERSENTGWWNSSCSRTLEPSALRRLAEELGFDPHALHRDMRYLLDSGDYADASLVFSSEGLQGPDRGPPAAVSGPTLQHHHHQRTGSDYGFRPRLELPCHRAVLSARSPFFRNIIVRRSRQLCNSDGGGGVGELRRVWQPTVRIALDEKVVPRRFARALLHATYTDQVDLNLIGRPNSITSQNTTNSNGNMLWSNSSNSASANSNAVQARTPSQLEDAMELYEIGRFLELDIVVQGCEDVIAEALSPGTLACIMRWSSLPHASRWIHRQAARFLRDDFAAVVHAPSLAQLQQDELQEALSSPFLQASEGMALKAAIKWAERALLKKLEEREPNVVSQTAHSVARRGLRRRDLCDAELKQILAPLLPALRLEHILPAEADVLHQAIRRGLVSAAPPHVIEGTVPGSASAWLGRGPYNTPRLFMPYLEEVKALLAAGGAGAGEADAARARRTRYSPHIPDTLYMVSADRRARRRSPQPAECRQRETGDGAPASGRAVSPPAPALLCARARRRELRAAPVCVRALSLPLARPDDIDTQICLRAVRELGLPDSVATLLGPAEDADAGGACSACTTPHSADDHCPPHRSESRVSSRARTPVGAVGQAVDLCLEAPVFPEGAELPHGYHNNTTNRCLGSGTSSLSRRDALSLSCRVPDVAAATVASRADARPDARLEARRQEARRHERAYTDGNRHLLQEYSTGGASVLRAVHRTAHRLAREWQGDGNGGLELDLGDGTPHAPQARPGSRSVGRSLLCGAGAGPPCAGAGPPCAGAPPPPDYTAATIQALASLQCRPPSQPRDERSNVDQNLLQAYGMGHHHQHRALSPTLSHPLNTPPAHTEPVFVHPSNSHPNSHTNYNSLSRSSNPQSHSYNSQAQSINYQASSVRSQAHSLNSQSHSLNSQPHSLNSQSHSPKSQPRLILQHQFLNSQPHSLNSQPHSLNSQARESPFCTYRSTRSTSNIESCNSNSYRGESPPNSYHSEVLVQSNSMSESPCRTLEPCNYSVREGSFYGRSPGYSGVSRLDPGFTLTSRSCSPNRSFPTHSHQSVSRTLSNSPGNSRVLSSSPGNARFLTNSPSVSSCGFKSESSSRPPSRDSRIQSSSGSISGESPGQGSTRGSGRSERGFRSLDSGNNGPPRFL